MDYVETHSITAPVGFSGDGVFLHRCKRCCYFCKVVKCHWRRATESLRAENFKEMGAIIERTLSHIPMQAISQTWMQVMHEGLCNWLKWTGRFAWVETQSCWGPVSADLMSHCLRCCSGGTEMTSARLTQTLCQPGWTDNSWLAGTSRSRGKGVCWGQHRVEDQWSWYMNGFIYLDQWKPDSNLPFIYRNLNICIAFHAFQLSQKADISIYPSIYL